MKNSQLVIYALVAGALTLVITPANAATTTASGGNWYTGISGDLTWPNHADVGGGGNINLGYQFAPHNSGMGNLRLEAEAGYHSASGDSGYSDLRYFTYMGNAYYDFPRMNSLSGANWHVQPYIGGGIGDAAVHTGNANFTSTFHHHENIFAYQGMAGLGFGFDSMPHTDWTLGYRYLGTDHDNGVQLHANNLEIGLRYHF